MKHGFLIDMDGVIYRGNEVIEGAQKFINFLCDRSIPFTFVTNNSQRTRKDIAIKLNRMGFRVSEEQVYTSALATAQFLAKQQPSGTAYVIGEGGLLTALHANGYAIVDSDPDFVVVGEGRTLTFETLEKATNLIYRGARLVATNMDPTCPTQDGTRPGCGAIVKMLEASAQCTAFTTGKPSPVIFRMARKAIDLRTEETFVIGDTMETDILGAVSMGYKTILTLTGSTKKADLPSYPYQPTHVINSINDIFSLKDIFS